jgi:hypothetical protein
MSTVNYSDADVDGLSALRGEAGRVDAPALLLFQGGE